MNPDIRRSAAKLHERKKMAIWPPVCPRCLRFYSLRPPPRGNPTKSLLSDQENCCRALPLFTVRCGPLSFWFGLPAILPSPPFLSLLSLVMYSRCASLCTAVVGLFFVVVVLLGSLPSDKFSLVPVKTGSLLVSHFGSPLFLLIVLLCLLWLLLFQR